MYAVFSGMMPAVGANVLGQVASVFVGGIILRMFAWKVEIVLKKIQFFIIMFIVTGEIKCVKGGKSIIVLFIKPLEVYLACSGCFFLHIDYTKVT